MIKILLPVFLTAASIGITTTPELTASELNETDYANNSPATSDFSNEISTIKDYIQIKSTVERVLEINTLEPRRSFILFENLKKAELALKNTGQPVITDHSSYADLTHEWKLSIVTCIFTAEDLCTDGDPINGPLYPQL